MAVPAKKHSSGEADTLEAKLLKRQIRGLRAVSAAIRMYLDGIIIKPSNSAYDKFRHSTPFSIHLIMTKLT